MCALGASALVQKSALQAADDYLDHGKIIKDKIMIGDVEKDATEWGTKVPITDTGVTSVTVHGCHYKVTLHLTASKGIPGTYAFSAGKCDCSLSDEEAVDEQAFNFAAGMGDAAPGAATFSVESC